MERIASFLDKLEDAGGERDAGIELHKLRLLWPQLVGGSAAEVSYPREVERGVLRVEVLHSSAAQLLQMQSGQLCRRLGEEFPCLAIGRVCTKLVSRLTEQPRPPAAPLAPLANQLTPLANPLESLQKVGGGQQLPHSQPQLFQALLQQIRQNSSPGDEH